MQQALFWQFILIDVWGTVMNFITRHKIFIFYVLVILIGVAAYTFIYHSSNKDINSIKIAPRKIISEDNTLEYRLLKEKEPKRELYKTYVSGQDLKSLGSGIDYALIVPQMNCQAYSVYFNGTLLGGVGDTKEGRSNIWNSVNSFFIDGSSADDSNMIEFDTLAEYQTGLGFSSVSIIPASSLPEYISGVDFFFEDINRIALGIALFGFIISFMLFLVSAPKNSSFLFFSISLLLIGLYTFDYTLILKLPFDYIIYKKIIMGALYFSVFFASLGMYKFFHCKSDLFAGITLIAGFLVIVLITKDMIAFKTIYNYYNFMLAVVFVSWLRTAIKYYKKSDEAKMFFFGTLIMIILAAIEIYSALSGRPLIYGSPLIFAFLFSMTVIILFFREFFNKDMQIQIVNNAHKESYLASITDGMTGLYNHRYLAHILRQTAPPFSVAMIDIDDFKEINDNYGHRFGDEILNYLASSLTSHVRSTDFVFRYGGDEFFIIFPGCSAENAREVLLKIKNKINQNSPKHDDKNINVTFSGGIYYVESMQAVENIYDKVDNPLYTSKKQGKNKVTIYSQE